MENSVTQFKIKYDRLKNILDNVGNALHYREYIQKKLKELEKDFKNLGYGYLFKVTVHEGKHMYLIGISESTIRDLFEIEYPGMSIKNVVQIPTKIFINNEYLSGESSQE